MKEPKILLVDDSEFMRGVLKEILKTNGFNNIVEAQYGDQALVKFMSEKPDLILLDLLMPEDGGIDVLKEIGTKANIIVVSKVDDENIKRRTFDLGAKGYIMKPFENQKVIDEINRVLGEAMKGAAV
jgi:two-component system, chemotaxis family, chemotaxis protein CheY